jgi:DUF1009 family protein
MDKEKQLGIIAGNRLLPIILSQRIKEKDRNSYLVAVCFKGETSRRILKYVDKCYWVKVGCLNNLREVIKKDSIKNWIMAGQINPLYIFKRKHWDEELSSLIDNTCDFRPHAIFNKMIDYLKTTGIDFLDSTSYLKEDLAKTGEMTGLGIDEDLSKNIDFGLGLVSKFVELDIGQTVVVKDCSVVGLESLEGTDRTIKRSYRLAGQNCLVLKFCKSNQDLRFDVPVVGISTLRLLKNIKAAGLVLEKDKVIILEKSKFISLARKWKIPVIGKERIT